MIFLDAITPGYYEQFGRARNACHCMEAQSMIPTVDHSASIRLRRLDALFAERVLGFHNPGATWPLPEYSRSLDAAWEGAERYDWFRVTRQLIANGGQCCVEIEHSEFPRLGQATCPHPAEALVIAALRAVGVPESDLV